MARKKKVVILDVDGTLMDTNYLHVEAWARAFEEVGEQPARSTIHRQIGKGSDKLAEGLLQDWRKAGRVLELHGRFYAQIQGRGHPLPGAKELIRSLAEGGYEAWFATSARPAELEQYLAALGAEGKVAGVISSSEVTRTKPDPDVFVLALERAGVPPESAVAVGDSVWDVRSAVGAGVRVASVLTGGAFCRSELEEAGAFAVYEDCAELLEEGFPEGVFPKEQARRQD